MLPGFSWMLSAGGAESQGPVWAHKALLHQRFQAVNSLAAVVNLDKMSELPKETSAHGLYVTRDHILMSTNEKTPQKSELTHFSLVRDS